MADPYVVEALFHLNELRKTVNDGLTGPNDSFLKTSLIQDLDTVEMHLRKALA